MRLWLFRYMALVDMPAGECDVCFLGYTGHGKRRRVVGRLPTSHSHSFQSASFRLTMSSRNPWGRI